MTSSSVPTGRPLGLVTGASSGIGLELARELANRGWDLVIVAEDSQIHEVATELDATDVTAIQADLATREGNDEVLSLLAKNGRQLDIAAINAGVGVGGPLTETSMDDHLNLVALNVASTVQLGKTIAELMVAAGEGRMLFTSSVASQMPGPLNSTYAASKSFVQSFAEALHEELKDKGVTVTALMPGPTNTEFFERADMQNTTIGQGPKDDPADVARQALDAAIAGDDHVVTGTSNRLQTALAALLPDKLKAKVHQRMNDTQD
ncbi:MAG: oxidoreductase [Marmoricola sp.]|nr:oxidoreductase [Marmoricola sp.]